ISHQCPQAVSLGLHKRSPPSRTEFLACVGRLCLFSRDFQSLGLKLTPLGTAVPLPRTSDH
ncbi:MAG TPA: hypothetical protein V6D48_21900, partial [Oculatellaceae cyanobacterium]